jgi:hypothetical protein
MDAEHAKQARAFEARRQQLEQELQASAASSATTAAASSAAAYDDVSVTLHDVSNDVSDDEAAALHDGADHSQYDVRVGAVAGAASPPTLSEVYWHSSADCDKQTASYNADNADGADSSAQQQCTLEVSVVESTLGCSQQWQRSSTADAATAYTVQESDDEED